MKKKKITTTLFCAALAFSVLTTGCSGNKTSSEEPVVSSDSQAKSGLDEQGEQSGRLVSFEAETLDGQTFTQEDMAQKDVTVINFWSTSCGPCIDELPDIAELAESLPDNVQIITACLDGMEQTDFAKEILDGAGFTGITLISGKGDLGQLGSEIQYTPTTVVVDKEGNIVGDAIIGGQKNLDEVFTEAINQALRSMGKTEISGEEK